MGAVAVCGERDHNRKVTAMLQKKVAGVFKLCLQVCCQVNSSTVIPGRCCFSVVLASPAAVGTPV